MSPRERIDASMPRTESASSLSADSSSRSKGVAFGSVSVRVFERIVSDHPDVRVGPPIGIGWAYNELPEQPLDDYERSLPMKRRVLRLSSVTRRNMLKNTFEIDEKEIMKAEREVAKIQRQREETSKQGKASELVESALQSAKRKIRRRFSSESFFKGLSGASGTMVPFGVYP